MGTHVQNNSGKMEWYTPSNYIKLVKQVMGGIDLDPASCEDANRLVGARHYFSMTDDGLLHSWRGSVYMNPPYGSNLVKMFTRKLCFEYKAGRISEAIVLTNNATETQWASNLLGTCDAVCFPIKRIRFFDTTLKPAKTPLQGQMFTYFGTNFDHFIEVFTPIGSCFTST